MKNKPTYPSLRSESDPEITIRLPRMSAREALQVTEILAELDAAICWLHGDAMADKLALQEVDSPCPPDDLGHRDVDDDILLAQEHLEYLERSSSPQEPTSGSRSRS